VKYQPVVAAVSATLKALALVGATTVVLGFDLCDATAQRAGLLGFAIRRNQFPDGAPEWLKNPLKFARFPYAGYQVAGTDSQLAPIQQFRWVDEGVVPEHAYRYTITTVYGTAEHLELRDTIDLDLFTASTDSGALSLHFNRGVIATPAYRQQFDNKRPDQQPAALVASAEAYLSRGLHEALIDFIAAAAPGDSLDIAIYEFQHESIVAALHQALDRGVNVRLLYHAKADTTGRANAPYVAALQQQTSASAGRLEVHPRRKVPNLSHNKLIIHRRANVPIRVWSGSTNFTDSGFFLQTNVGIVLRDSAIVATYAAYIDLLLTDPLPDQARAATGALASAMGIPADTQLFFSPIAGDAMLQAAVALIRAARAVVLISCPFGMDASISMAIAQLAPNVLVYGLLNTNQSGDLRVFAGDVHQTQEFVVPEWIKALNGAAYDASTGQGNRVHVKALIIDPWGERPQMLIGSANFSDESVNLNDENALLITGDRWAAAIAATEFLRVFGHYQFRNRVKQIAQAYDTRVSQAHPPITLGTVDDAQDPNAIWLVAPDEIFEDDQAGADGGTAVLAVEIANLWLSESDAWLTRAFTDGDIRQRERQIFAGD
jgi:phosphatidylserine/phosphatidylglycerophosphate/cardiolipin synthase-like enzyme